MFAIGIKELGAGKHLGDGEVVRIDSRGNIVEKFGTEPMFQARKTLELARTIYTDDLFLALPKCWKRLRTQAIEKLN